MGTVPDPLVSFLQLCGQVIWVITAVILLVSAYFQARYARTRDAYLQWRFRKAKASSTSGEPLTMDQEERHSSDR